MQYEVRERESTRPYRFFRVFIAATPEHPELCIAEHKIKRAKTREEEMTALNIWLERSGYGDAVLQSKKEVE